MSAIDLFTVLQVILLASILLVGFELILRSRGAKPFSIKMEKSTILPEGKYYEEHDTLGFVHQPGEFTLNINDRFTFSAKHNENGLRVTSKNSTPEDFNKPQIWIFGCSFTYGWLVEDHETFPWLLQEQLPDWKVVNFGVNGYGTLQSYLQYKEAISKQGAPQVVMLIYGSGIHDRRNSLTRGRKKAFSRLERGSPFKVPCGRIDGRGNLTIKYDRYKYIGLPLKSYSALINYIETRYNTYHDAKLKSREVTKKILDEFYRECSENNSTFVVAGIHGDKRTQKMLEYCENKGMRTVDISVDARPEHSHYPHDNHPSALAHSKYADRIARFMEEKKLVTN